MLRATEERVLREEISTVAIGALSSAAGAAAAAMSVVADATAAATAVCARAGKLKPAAHAPSKTWKEWRRRASVKWVVIISLWKVGSNTSCAA
ncbi:hypothetical protein [Janthinobacterium sp. HH106]|uniref:hypothetical protein n=1 Tax=Janthinobacterium sp. HH106 TaxID=1537278 RepID=UPI0020C820CB|nr:hypothetical protein [Janthinobacterium sp. HH106]